LVPAIQLAAFAAIVAIVIALYRWQRSRLVRLPRAVQLAVIAGGAAAAAAGHLARFPVLLEDPRAPAALQLIAAALAAAATLAIPVARLPVQLGRRALIATASAVVLLLAAFVFAGRIAPGSYPVAAATIQARGLVAAQVAALTAGLGDRDGDGFAGLFGGMDCDDGDPEIHPLATDIPDNGVDEDCFEGDLSAEVLAADRQVRLARRRPPRQRARNLILITVDALRADAVGFGGAEHPSSPTMDGLAAGGATFARAYSQAPMTRRAFPALLAGRYPANIHWLDLESRYPYTVSHPDNLYLAEVARDAGLATGAVLGFAYARKAGFDQGFQERKVHRWGQVRSKRTGDRIVDDGIALIRQWRAGGDRFLLWLHFYEAHHPYVRHAPYDFGDGDYERYLSEVRWIDAQLERLMAALVELGIEGETAVVFTGDHGEEFGEHGGEYHGDLYREDLHVPLLVAGPGIGARRLEAPVGLIDVAPTILELLGIEIPEAFDGDSLLPWIETGEEPDERHVYAELIPDRRVKRRVATLIGRRWQLILDFELGNRELFDLEADPGAQINALAAAPEVARAMERRLRRRMALRIGPIRESTRR
jgi:arylsulfatase A-like enzyme